MDIYTRVQNLERLVNALIEAQNNNKFYYDTDIEGVRQNISEVDQKMNDSIYPVWNDNGYEYFQGERVSYKNKLYRCIQNHTSQSDWAPDKAVSLWVSISDPGEEWPDWVQPVGAHDAYAKGDKVSHKDKHWISDVDANVWEPGVYGWSEA